MNYEVLIASTFLLAAAGSSRGATGMVNAGEVLLPTGVDAQYSAAIDPTTGFGYFGTSGSDPVGYVSKINLNGPTPTLVSSAAEGIPGGISGMLGITVDSGVNPFQHDLYVGTATGQVLHMSPGTASTPPQVISTITPNSGAIVHGFTDPSQNFAYFVARNGSTSDNLIRVNMSTGAYAGTVQLPIGESAALGQMNSFRYGGIDTINHYAYLTNNIGFLNGHTNDNPDSPEICKINLQTAFKNTTGNSTPVVGTDYTVLDLSSTVAGQGISRVGFSNPAIDEGITIDAAHGFAYIGTYNCDLTASALNQSTWPYNQSIVARISLGTPADGANFPASPVAGILTLQPGERDLTVGLLDPANGNLYFGTDNTYPAHVYMIHVGDGTQPMSEVGRLDLKPGTAVPYPPGGILDGETHVGSNAAQYGEIYLRSGIINPANNTLYYGTDSTVGQVVQVDINQIPEPASAAMLSVGAAGLLLRRRRGLKCS